MQGFGRLRPVVPHRSRIAEVGFWIPLLGVDEVWKFERVPQEKHWRVVAHQVPIAFLCIELKRKTTHVSLSIGRTAFTSYCGKPQEHICLHAYFGQEVGAGDVGDIFGHRESAESTRTLSMHHTLGEALPIKVRKLFK